MTVHGVSTSGRFFEYIHLQFRYHNRPHEFLWALWLTMRCIQCHVTSQLVYYMDDILLQSPSMQSHQHDLEVVFQELQRDGWRLNWDICNFVQDYFDYLGVIITPWGLQPSVFVLKQFQRASMPNTRGA